MTTCTTNDCGMDATLYICPQCIRDLQAWLDKCAEVLPELDVTIARLDNVRVGNSEGGNGSKSAGSSSPLNLDAMQLKINLATLTQSAEHYAHDQFAAGIAWTIQDWYTKAELLISGPEEERVDHQEIKEKIANQAPPMATRELRKWLRENAKISVSSMDIRNWVRRGKLAPAQREPQPTYWPHEVLQAKRETTDRNF